jgi:hypothetical protein
MDWLYIWSPRYQFFHEVVSSCVKDLSGIQLVPIFAEQHFFTPRSETGHFLTGIPIKLHVIANYIRRHMGSTFIFSDVDLIVFPRFCIEDLAPYHSNEITTLRESPYTLYHNIGFLMIQCTPETLDFFERVLTRTRSENKLDQDVFNEELQSFPGRVGFFDVSGYIQSNSLHEEQADSFDSLRIIQCLTSQSDPTEILAEKAYTMSLFLDLTNFRSYLPEAVLKILDAKLEACEA